MHYSRARRFREFLTKYKLIKNKPLIHWTITESLKSKYIDEIILSTDSQEIKNIVESYGLSIPFLRPYELAQDNSPTIDTILYILKKLTIMII